MKNKQSILIAAAGAALAAALPAQAGQLNYQNEDLLLDFRNTGDLSAADVTVDLGQVSTFLNLTAATALDTTANHGYTPLFNETELINAFGGSLEGVGFTVVATDSASKTT